MKLYPLTLNALVLVMFGVATYVPTLSVVDVPQVFAQAEYGDEGYGSGQYGQDTIAPTLSAASDNETGQTSSGGSVTTNDARGTLYWVVTTSASTPSVAQVLAGNDHTGSGASADGSQAVTATGVQNTSATGLLGNTAYFTHFMHEDAGSNQSLVVSASGFTTDATPDTTAPILSSPTDVETGQSTADGSVATDEGNGTLYWVVTTSASTPSVAQVLAGNDHTGSGASADGSQIVAATGVQNVSASSLSGSTNYFIHYMHEDASGNQSSVSSADGFTTDVASDTTAPVLTSPSDSETGQTTSSGSVTTNEGNGTLYFVVTVSSVTPTASQVIAGQDNTGTGAVAAGSQVVSTTGTQNINATGLSSNTTYFTHFVHEDASTNQSNVISASGFSTDATSSGSTSSGGGGGGGSSSDEITIDTVSALSTSATITGTVDDDATDLLVIMSDSDSTIFCSNYDDDGYTVTNINGTFEKDEEFTISVTGLDSETEYHFVVCGEVDDDEERSDVESFTTAALGETVPVTTTTNPVTSTPSVVTTLPANTSFDRNVSFIQQEINDPVDVQNLQIFLNEFEGESLAVTGSYDSASNEAIKRFQRKYAREILDVWSLSEATGYVGITTRLKMNFLIKGQTAVCPAFTEFNGGRDGIFESAEVMRTKQILADLDMYSGSIDRIWTPQTNDAMVLFQETFREVMLDPWNITKGTGYKYKTTNKFLNYFAGCDTGAIELEGVGIYEGI